jgi:hypothetical protein
MRLRQNSMTVVACSSCANNGETTPNPSKLDSFQRAAKVEHVTSLHLWCPETQLCFCCYAVSFDFSDLWSNGFSADASRADKSAWSK